jgi:hypothetical protein
VTAGIAESSEFHDVDRLIHEADLALITTKRKDQSAAIYSLELEAVAATGDDPLGGDVPVGTRPRVVVPATSAA